MYYLAAPLVIANGTLGCRGAPVGNHCSITTRYDVKYLLAVGINTF